MAGSHVKGVGAIDSPSLFTKREVNRAIILGSDAASASTPVSRALRCTGTRDWCKVGKKERVHKGKKKKKKKSKLQG